MENTFFAVIATIILAIFGYRIYRYGISKGISETFKNKDIVSVLFSYMIEQNRYIDEFSLYAGYKLIEEDARKEILSDRIDVKDKIYKQNMLPSDVMHIIVFNITDNDLRNGRYNSSKGVLSDKGILINILWDHTIKILCERNLLDRGIYDSARASMKKAISNSG
jgi:hypothetical protein